MVKNVTPTDDLDELLGAAADKAASHADRDVRALVTIADTLRPATDTIRATVADISLLQVARATPAQRTALVELRALLDRARADLSTWVDAIDISFRRAAVETGAAEIVLADGVVKVEPPRGEWVVNVPALKAELSQLAAHGLLTADELDSIFTTTVSEGANNAKLNYFAKQRGQEVAEAIGRYRVWREGNPANAKVRIQRKQQREEKA